MLNYVNKHKKIFYSIVKNVIKSIGILLGATLLGFVFFHLGFTAPNIIMVYILGVLLTSIATSHLIYSLVSSIASVFIFNYYFTVPRFSLTAYGTGYPVTFVIMFLTAFITGTFAIRYKAQAAQAEKNAYRTSILFDTNRLLSKAKDKEEILTTTAEQIVKLSDCNLVIFEEKNGKLSGPRFFLTEKQKQVYYDLEKEKQIVQGVYENKYAVASGMDHFQNTKYKYVPLKVLDHVYGVIGIESVMEQNDKLEQEILLSIIGECTLALENEKNLREKEEAAVLAKNEQLRANLLRTISHDLRTPLTTILGNASNLINNDLNFDSETKKQIYKDIYEDSMWLINLVENLLSATRIEEGRMKLLISTEVLEDIVEEAWSHIKRKQIQQKVEICHYDELILVKADAKLIVQVILNIVDNAVKYTSADSCIRIETDMKDNMAEIRISDNGSGISDEEKSKIFNMFYCGEHKVADNRRSLGLGLYLCKAIVEEHGGTLWVNDNQPKGTIFGFTLPLEEVTYHE